MKESKEASKKKASESVPARSREEGSNQEFAR